MLYQTEIYKFIISDFCERAYSCPIHDVKQPSWKLAKLQTQFGHAEVQHLINEGIIALSPEGHVLLASDVKGTVACLINTFLCCHDLKSFDELKRRFPVGALISEHELKKHWEFWKDLSPGFKFQDDAIEHRELAIV